MRSETDRRKLEQFMVALGQSVRGEGTIYLTGGATALLHNWRAMTIDVDLKPDPEPAGLFEAIARLNLDRSRVKAPFEGAVAERVAEGNPVKGLFPPTGQWKEEFQQWLAEHPASDD